MAANVIEPVKKGRQLKLLIPTGLNPIFLIIFFFFTSLPVIDFKRLLNSLSYSVLALYKVVTSG